MKEKKLRSKNYKYKRPDFLLIGLLLSLSMVFSAFSITITPKNYIICDFGPPVLYSWEIIPRDTGLRIRPFPRIRLVDDSSTIPADNPKFVYYETDQETAIVIDIVKDVITCPMEPYLLPNLDELPLLNGVAFDTALPTYLKENLKYPEEARANSISGQVVVKFEITNKGTIQDIQTLTPASGYGFEEAVIKVIKSTSGKWTAGRKDNKVVNSLCAVPINFVLD